MRIYKMSLLLLSNLLLNFSFSDLALSSESAVEQNLKKGKNVTCLYIMQNDDLSEENIVASIQRFVDIKRTEQSKLTTIWKQSLKRYKSKKRNNINNNLEPIIE